MRELAHLLPDMTPPPGGLARLQQSIASTRDRTHAPRTRWAWPAVACLVGAAFVVWAPRWFVQTQHAQAIVEALEQGVSLKSPMDGIRVAHGAAIELPSGQANVRLYLVQSANNEVHPR